MSLMPTYVLADDNKMYKDPVLFGEDWFLCFDDDEDPEIVISVDNKKSKIEMFDYANNVLTEAGFIFRLKYDSNNPRKCSRCFPPSNKHKKAASFAVDIKQPIPAKCKMRHGKVLTIEDFTKNTPQCVFYTFGRKIW